jgi:hypothetical protein
MNSVCQNGGNWRQSAATKQLAPPRGSAYQWLAPKLKDFLMRCRLCNKAVAAIGVACICGEVVKSEVGPLYVSPDQPHIENEQKLPYTESPLTIVRASSTVNVNGLSLLSWNPIRAPNGSPLSLLWRVSPPST